MKTMGKVLRGMVDVVLDASAILAVIFEEPGSYRVAEHLPGAIASTVNLAEVMSKLADRGMPEETIETIVSSLQLTVHPLDLAQAYLIAQLRPVTKQAGLSLGDRACLALAKQLNIPTLTTDKAWKGIAKAAKVKVELLR